MLAIKQGFWGSTVESVSCSRRDCGPGVRFDIQFGVQVGLFTWSKSLVRRIIACWCRALFGELLESVRRFAFKWRLSGSGCSDRSIGNLIYTRCLRNVTVPRQIYGAIAVNGSGTDLAVELANAGSRMRVTWGCQKVGQSGHGI